MQKPVTLKLGSHEPNGDQMCVMEYIAYIEGEPWSDRPTCVCPIIGCLLRTWNDTFDEDDCQRTDVLLPLVSTVIGTNSDDLNVKIKRSWLAIDWDIRVRTTTWLRASGLEQEAVSIESIPTIESCEKLEKYFDTFKKAANIAIISSSVSASYQDAPDFDSIRNITSKTFDHVNIVSKLTSWNEGAIKEYELDRNWDILADDAIHNCTYAGWYATMGCVLASCEGTSKISESYLQPTKDFLQHSAKDLIRRMAEVK